MTFRGKAVRRTTRRVLSLMVLSVVAAGGFAAAAGAGSRPLVQDLTGGHFKPASFCPANHTCFSHVHWKRWNGIAVGRGTADFQAPGGAPRTFTTKITLSRVRRLCGGLRYTRAVWHGGNTTFIRLGNCGAWTGG
jgi:hypothetical protein